MRIRFLLLALLAVLPAPAGAGAAVRGPGPETATELFDSRLVQPARGATAVAASVRGARRDLRRRLGPQGVVATDPVHGTARAVLRLDGTLTGPSDGGPAAVARDYLRRHATALGVTQADLRSLRLQSRETTADGLTVLRWVQTADGVPAFDSGLAVAVNRAGMVVSVTGSPARGLSVSDTTPELRPEEAVAVLVRSTDGNPAREAASADTSLVVFARDGADALAYDVVAPGGDGLLYHGAVDARTGRLLYRTSLTKFAVNAKVYPNHPADGDLQTVPLDPYLTPGATTLTGPYARVFADLNDNNQPGASEEATPGEHEIIPAVFGSVCAAQWVCSWNHADAVATRAQNLDQNANQVFWLVNHFRDHLADAPIGFTGAGSFESTDPVVVHTLDGASKGPDANHLNNASMSTLPDGDSPLMEAFLFSSAGSPFRDVNGGDSADIVYHEYTHGLSNRLVVGAGGFGALDSAQAGAMGEAWSDWYAMDLLHREGRIDDLPGTADVRIGAYLEEIPNSLRTQPLDCQVGETTGCPGDGSAGAGGYTYGDFGKIAFGAEVHADGEIWAGTLWDLRRELIAELGSTVAGSDVAEQLVTNAMRISPPEPSFLDMRNAIVASTANATVKQIIWTVFANRGMGYFATTTGGTDVQPVEDFSLPPDVNGPKGSIAGRITDQDTGAAIPAATVALGGQTGIVTTTDAGGRYRLDNIPASAVARQLVVTGPAGWTRTSGTAVVADGQTTPVDLVVRRNWAGTAGGGSIEGAEPSFCGPTSAIDGSQAVGWSAENPTFAGGPVPVITIVLPEAVDVTAFGIDPSATCGDGASAGLREYRIETSANGTDFTVAREGAFASGNSGRLNVLAPSATPTKVRYVRVTLLTPLDDCEECSGKQWIDLTEIEVYGPASNRPPAGTLAVPASTPAGQAVTLDASGFADPDGTIAGYEWDLDGDGTVDTTTTGPTVANTYEAPGEVTPSVHARDDDGETGTASATLLVTDAAAPPPAVAPARPRLQLGKQPANALAVRVICASACRGKVTATLPRALARRLGLKSRVAAQRTLRPAAGARTVRVPLSRAVLRRLRARDLARVRVALTIQLTDAAGRRTRLARTVRVKITPG